MTILLGGLGAVVALILAYFLFGGMVADWLDRECDVMLAQADAEEDYSFRFWLRGMTEEANWHAETAEILRSNARVCQRTAGWLRRSAPSCFGAYLGGSVQAERDCETCKREQR